MVCGDINYTIDSNGVNCVTVELSDGQITFWFVGSEGINSFFVLVEYNTKNELV